MLELVPISLKEANAYVERYHRHHKPVVGHKFSIAAAVDGEIVGVAIVGRPVSRYLDDGWTLEVNRLCTNGYRNACSFLYSAAWRAARNLGYKKLMEELTEVIEEIRPYNPGLSLVKCLVTMFTNDISVVKGEEALRKSEYSTFNTHIRYSKKVVDWTYEKRKSLIETTPRSAATRDYKSLAAEYIRLTRKEG